MATVKEIFDAMPSRFNKGAAAGMNAVYQFDITGEGGGKYYAAIANGALTVAEGEHKSPNITLTMGAQDYIDMVEGRLNGQMAFMTGKLKIKGDMSLAMKLNTLFLQ
jgi:putative sterol carrier protein